MGGGEVLKKGWLIKSPPLGGGGIKNWRKRWFLLLSSKVLEYYKSESGEQKGVVNLEDCRAVNSNLYHKRYKHVFNIETKERVYFLVAKSQKEMEEWVEAVCRVCGLMSEQNPVVIPEAMKTLPASSKSKGPNISQPVYATTSRGVPFTEQFKTTARNESADAVYSLAAAAELETQYQLNRKSQEIPSGVPLSDALTSKGLGSGDTGGQRETSRGSVGSGGSGDVAANRLSDGAFFSPRPGDNLGYLGNPTDPRSMYSSPGQPQHMAVTKSRSATLAPQLDAAPSSIGQRSFTNAMAFSSPQQPLAGAELLPNGYMKPRSVLEQPTSSSTYSSVNTSHRSALLQKGAVPPTDAPSSTEGTFSGGDAERPAPPPIDRSSKPPHTTVPPAIDRSLKPGKRAEESSDSAEDSPPQRRESLASAAAHMSPDRADGKEETEFNMTDIPRITPRSMHYTQVEFDAAHRRPLPLPRTPQSAGVTPAPVVPKPRRVNYSDVDLQATNQLAERIQKHVSVREAVIDDLAQREYVNIDSSGMVDDETDPDYYTHMRSFNFDEADKPDYLTFGMWEHRQHKYGDTDETQDSHQNYGDT